MKAEYLPTFIRDLKTLKKSPIYESMRISLLADQVRDGKIWLGLRMIISDFSIN